MATWWPKPRLPQWNITTTWFGSVIPKARASPASKMFSGRATWISR